MRLSLSSVQMRATGVGFIVVACLMVLVGQWLVAFFVWSFSFFLREAGGELFAGGHRGAAAGARRPWGPSVPYQIDTLTFGAKHIHKNVIHCKY